MFSGGKVFPALSGFILTLILLSSGLVSVEADCVCHGLWPNRKVTQSPVDSEYCMSACGVNRSISVDECKTTAYCRACNGSNTFKVCSVVENCYFAGLRTEACSGEPRPAW